ncbi:MAG: patatin-like phospholipase family protein [Clostridia bacterium]|nr:patatin-like phospholipase family protein [Clostridia bacterium]
MKKLGLALGAGGSRGVAHIGFLKALDEEGIRPDFISGSSMGSIVGAAYAAGVPIARMKEAVVNLHALDFLGLAGKRGGLFGTKKMRALLQRYIGDLQFSDLRVPFRCVAVDMCSQQVVEFSEGSVLDAIVASSSIPSIFHPQERDGMRLIDGGILERVPAELVKKMGANVVVAVDVIGQKPCKEECPNMIGMLMETMDIMDNYRTRARREENKKIIDMWLEPDMGTMSIYDLKKIEFAYEKGYETGKENVAQIKKLLGRR